MGAAIMHTLALASLLSGGVGAGCRGDQAPRSSDTRSSLGKAEKPHCSCCCNGSPVPERWGVQCQVAPSRALEAKVPQRDTFIPLPQGACKAQERCCSAEFRPPGGPPAAPPTPQGLLAPQSLKPDKYTPKSQEDSHPGEISKLSPIRPHCCSYKHQLCLPTNRHGSITSEDAGPLPSTDHEESTSLRVKPNPANTEFPLF